MTSERGAAADGDEPGAPVRYTADGVRRAVDTDRERLFAPYASGRPMGWAVDQRTRDLICVGYWLTEQLVHLGVSEDDRRTQQHYYNRWSRSVEDLFGLCATALNTALDGEVEQNRVPHRRWG